MRKHLLLSISTLVLTSAFTLSTSVYAGVLNDSDIPALRDAVKKAYANDNCKKDLPNASSQTCDCLGEKIGANLDADKLKLCETNGYDDCVAAQVVAAKAALTEDQINTCKAMSDNQKQDAPAASKSNDDAGDDTSDDSAN